MSGSGLARLVPASNAKVGVGSLATPMHTRGARNRHRVHILFPLFSRADEVTLRRCQLAARVPKVVGFRRLSGSERDEQSPKSCHAARDAESTLVPELGCVVACEDSAPVCWERHKLCYVSDTNVVAPCQQCSAAGRGGPQPCCWGEFYVLVNSIPRTFSVLTSNAGM